VKRVLVLLPKGFEMLEAAAFIDVLGWANEVGNEAIAFSTVGLSDSISCAFGSFRLIPDLLLHEVNSQAFDALALPGGFEPPGYYEEAYSEGVLELIRQFHQEEKPIASICVGALPLGKSGILQGRKATTYHLSGGHRRDQLARFKAVIQKEHLVKDAHLITSSCPATAVEVAFSLLELLTGKENCALVRKEMGFS
jgi:4-methyl-5(b-hydroxyethyl)-thiazole monophosphate biosynthesis